jgi:hypothetical protein
MKITLEKVGKFFQRRKNDLIYYLAVFGVHFFELIPMSVGMRLGALLGLGAYYILTSERKKALTHLHIAFGKEKSFKEIKQIAKASFRNLGKNAIELINSAKMMNNIDTYFFIDGQEYLKQALSEGKGLLLLTAHMGNWELMAFYWAARGYPFRVIARKAYDTRLNDLLMRFRRKAGVQTIFRDSPRAGREILQALKRREVLAMIARHDLLGLIDVEVSGHDIPRRHPRSEISRYDAPYAAGAKNDGFQAKPFRHGGCPVLKRSNLTKGFQASRDGKAALATASICRRETLGRLKSSQVIAIGVFVFGADIGS